MRASNPSLGTSEAYVPGLSREHVATTYGIALDDVAKLGSAENPFGPSPKAAAAESGDENRHLSGMDGEAAARKNRVQVRIFAGAGDLRRGRDRAHSIDRSR